MKKGILNNAKGVLIGILISIVSFIAGYFVSSIWIRSTKQSNNAANSVKVEKRQSGFKLINPILDCQSVVNVEPPKVVILHSSLEQYIQNAKGNGSATHVSVYFRDLNNGPIIGIGQDETYAPASLLKVPILIAALKEEERNPGFLNRKIKYSQVVDPGYKQNIVDSISLKIGNSYSVLDLAERMIVHSDNEAKGLIVQLIPDSSLVRVHNDLGIVVPGIRNSQDFMTVRDYATFFRILYNGTYLNHKNSELALEFLSRSTFIKGIKAGISDPYAIVAHKFGERELKETNQRQLHDCGIVYSNGHTYLLCVMTRGRDFNQLAKVISEVSGIVYNNIE
jgi:beta-lactamase class A